jgi:hypothetical protein
MKKLFVSALIIIAGTSSFAQSKDTTKHWSVGVDCSIMVLPAFRLPDYPDEGPPLVDVFNTPVYDEHTASGSGSTYGVHASFFSNRRIGFQIGLLSTTEFVGYFTVGVKAYGQTYGPPTFVCDSNAMEIGNYKIKYLEMPLLFRYNYIAKPKKKAFVALGTNIGFINYEKINRSQKPLWTNQVFENDKFRINRILPEVLLGCDYLLGKTVSIFWACNFAYRPIYQKNNTYIKITHLKFALNAGLNFHF